MISNITNLSPYTYSVSPNGSAGKLFVPVNPSSVVYAQFDHISGIAAGDGQSGVSVSKIQILNALIENLARIKSAPESRKPAKVSEDQAEALIKNYQSQIARAVKNSNPFALSGTRPEAGTLFSIDA